MKIRKIMLLFIVAFTGCIQKKSNLEKNLTNCFWDMLNKKQTNAPNSGYKFKKNGECSRFYYVFKDGKRADTVVLFNDDHVIVPHIWYVEGDTILNIRSFDLRIIRYNDDSIYLQRANKDTIILIKNCKTVSKSGYF